MHACGCDHHTLTCSSARKGNPQYQTPIHTLHVHASMPIHTTHVVYYTYMHAHTYAYTHIHKYVCMYVHTQREVFSKESDVIHQRSIRKICG